MKILAVFALAFVVLAGCRTANEPPLFEEQVSSGSGTTVRIFRSPQFGVEFLFPLDWEARKASGKSEGRALIAWLYTPQASAALRACEQTHPPADWPTLCAEEQKDVAIEVAESKDTTKERTGLVYQVKTPSGNYGVTIAVFPPTENRLSAAELVRSSLRFKSRK